MRKKLALLMSILLILPTPTRSEEKEEDFGPFYTLSPEQAQTVATFIALGTCATIIAFSKRLRRTSPRVKIALKLIALLSGAYAFAATITTYLPLYCGPTTRPQPSHNQKRRLARHRKHSWHKRFG
jgi:hypothetical protein